MTKSRKKFDAAFKAKIALEALEMERPEPRVRLCQIERGGGKLVAEGDVRAVAPPMKVLDWLDRRKRSPGPFPPTATDSGKGLG